MAIILYSKQKLDLCYMGIFSLLTSMSSSLCELSLWRTKLRGTNQPSASAHSHKRCLLGEDWWRTRLGEGGLCAGRGADATDGSQRTSRACWGTYQGTSPLLHLHTLAKPAAQLPMLCFWILIHYRPWSLLGVGGERAKVWCNRWKKRLHCLSHRLWTFPYFPSPDCCTEQLVFSKSLALTQRSSRSPATASVELNISPLQF